MKDEHFLEKYKISGKEEQKGIIGDAIAKPYREKLWLTLQIHCAFMNFRNQRKELLMNLIMYCKN